MVRLKDFYLQFMIEFKDILVPDDVVNAVDKVILTQSIQVMYTTGVGDLTIQFAQLYCLLVPYF